MLLRTVIFGGLLSLPTLNKCLYPPAVDFAPFYTRKLPVNTSEKLMARITFWAPSEDKWGWQKSTGGHLTAYYSAAVDPTVIPYGTQIKIPGLELTLRAEDTGSAVKSKKASRGAASRMLVDRLITRQQFKTLSQVPVIDICVPTAADVHRLKRDFPEFVQVTIDRPYGTKLTSFSPRS
jgi:hypothetical protein